MKYHIVEDRGFFLIRISGEPRKNEALPAKRMLCPYLKEKGIRVIMDLKELKNFEPIILLGVLHSKVHLWLENRFRFDLGNYVLEVVHIPGHTSGSICIYEFTRKILFTGDTLFAGGTLSYIGESGSVGDYINSINVLETRKINELYPGHGNVSKTPEEDMQKAIMNARPLLRDEEGVEITHFREVSLIIIKF